MPPPVSLNHAITCVVREEWGRILAALTTSFGDIQRAEDCLQDAVARALETWPEKGIPKSPAAWLITTARNKDIDRVRRDARFAKHIPELSHFADLANAPDETSEPALIPDKRLEMLFTCCHPALAEKTQIALTLRTLGGLSTEDIATCFLDDPKAIAQRLVRAKRKIKDAGIPYLIPEPKDLPIRLGSVLSVVYLIFSQGNAAATARSRQLSKEAIRLGRILRQLLPSDAEVGGLLALMLLTDARTAGRATDPSVFVPLDMQNRNLWDKSRIAEGDALLKSLLKQGQIGPYQLQAAISACHATSPSWEETNWTEIAALYGLLAQITPTPVVHLNHAVAMAYSGKLAQGLQMLDALESQSKIGGYQPYHAAMADLYAKAGRFAEAKDHYDRAITLSTNEAEQLFLSQKSASIP